MTRIEWSRCVRWRLGWLFGTHPDHAPSILHRHLQSPILFIASICVVDYNRLKQWSILCPSFWTNYLTEHHIPFKQSFLSFFDGLLSAPSSMISTIYAMTKFHLHHHPILVNVSSTGFPMSLADVSYICHCFFLPKHFYPWSHKGFLASAYFLLIWPEWKRWKLSQPTLIWVLILFVNEVNV